MSELAIQSGAEYEMGEQIAKPIRSRIRQGREHRKQFEANWALNLSYAAGDVWSMWDNDQRILRRIQDVDPRYRGRELYNPDVITEYRTTALGELGGDNDRPQLLLAQGRDDKASEDFQAQLNRATAYGWDNEWRGDTVLAENDGYLVDLGTSAIRCRFDPTAGAIKADNWPHVNGKPILDPEQARQQVAQALSEGRTMDMRPVREGRITWEAISALGLITPPGITHEDKFPWECIVRPVHVDMLAQQFGDLATNLKPDEDIRSDLGLTVTGATDSSWGTQESRQTRLKDHVWVFTYYERPTLQYPKGRVVTLGSNAMKLLAHDEQLPYVGPDGTYRSGISYFHWWRVTGRFWSRSLMDVMRDPARGIAKRKTQLNELIDRSMPFVFVEKDSKAKQRVGYPMEMIELDRNEREPKPMPGIPPGAWMPADVEALREDMEHATGFRGPRLGENPTGVTTYSQLSLINENEATKRNPTRQDRQRAIARLLEDSIYDMRTYWGPQKQVMLAPDDERAQAEVFNATQIPTAFIVSVAKGAPAPRNQAAKIQLITDIANYSIQAMTPVPVQWFKESLEAGEPLDLPQDAAENPADKAELENHLLLQGLTLPIAYYDVHGTHLPIHRRIQDDAMFAGDMQTWQRIEQHCQLHMNAALAQQQAALGQQGQAPAVGGQGAPAQQQGPGPLEMLQQAHGVRESAAKADLAEKKAQQSDFTPKPTTSKPSGGAS